MPVAELKAFIEKAKDQHDKQLGLSKNSSVDDIQLSDLVVPIEALASRAFTSAESRVPSKMIALRESYDVLSAHARLGDTYSRDRAFYYSNAVVEHGKHKAYLDYLYSSMSGMDSYGNK